MFEERKQFTGSIVSLDGAVLGEIQTFHYEPEKKELKDGENLSLFSLSNGATIHMENAHINTDFLDTFIAKDRKFRVEGTGYKYPRGNTLPKKKRIRKKWMKKYHRSFIYDNCVIL